MYCFHCGCEDTHVADGNGLCYCCAFDHPEGSDAPIFYCRVCGKTLCVGSCHRCQVDVQEIKCTCEVTILFLAGKYTLRTRNNGYDQLGASVRFYDQSGQKLVDWEARQFSDEPERTMAAFLHILCSPSLLENCRQSESGGFVAPANVQQDGCEQVVYTLEGKYDLCSGGKAYGVGSYVCFRVRGDCSEDGEIVYWDQQEWREQAEDVIGALLSCIQDPSQLGRHLMHRKNHLL